jgi:hypothetical protein
MESREQSESNPQDREEGTPQGQLLNEEPESDDTEAAAQEGGADSAADAAGEGG